MGSSVSATDRAFITGRVLYWARERARLKPEHVAKRLHQPTHSVISWEKGTASPTFSQAERLAEVLHVPFGYLFLPAPPAENIPLPDFRTVRNAETAKPSAELIDCLNDVLFKQQWYREFLLEQGASALPFVGMFSVRSKSTEVAQSVREVLKIDGDLRQRCTSHEDFLRAVIRNAEAAGILVMRSGIAAGNTRRSLSVREFRGFAISDPIAPVVFVNGKDWASAQIFTVAHELIHIWIGAPGISNEDIKQIAAHGSVEHFCNDTAAEVLLPADEFLQVWSMSRSMDDNIEIAAHSFRVSTLVAVRRAFDLQKITWKQYEQHYRHEEETFKLRAEKPARRGGNIYRNVIARNSATLTNAVVHGATAGKVLQRDAARLLNVNLPLVQKVAAYLAKQNKGT